MAKVPTFRGAVLGATAEQAAEANFVLAASNYTGREYGAFDAIADVAFGGILTTGLNAPLISKANRIARQQGRMTADIRATEAFFTSGEYTEGTNLLRKYSEDLDLVIKTDPEVESALNTPKDQRTPEAEAKVREFIDTYLQDVLVAGEKTEVTVDPDKPISEARAEAEAAAQRRVDDVKKKVAYRQERKRKTRGSIGFEDLPSKGVAKSFKKKLSEMAEPITSHGSYKEGLRVESKEEAQIRTAEKKLVSLKRQLKDEKLSNQQ